MLTESLDIKKFLSYYKEKSNEIKEQSFDLRQVKQLLDLFLDQLEMSLKSSTKDKIESNFHLFHETIFDFKFALETAFSNYRRENRNILAKIVGFGVSKLPNIKIPYLNFKEKS